jgi:quinol monooxygenase YgiN
MSGRKSFIAKLWAKPERLAAFERLLQELQREVRETLPGTLVYEILKSDEDPSHVVFVACFADEAAYQRHMNSPAHDRLVPPLLDCLAVPMEIAFFTTLA